LYLTFQVLLESAGPGGPRVDAASTLDVEKAGTLMNAVDKALGGTLPKTLEDM
jgi:hypothetical protein